MPRSAWATASLIGLVLSALGCAGAGLDSSAATPTPVPGTTVTPGTGNADFQTIQRQIFNQSCIGGSCHNTITRAGNLSLAEGESYAQLVNVPPDNVSARRAGLVRVAPFQPDGSFLVVKLTNPTGQGSRMPSSAPPLSTDQINLVRDWIAAGALEFAGPSPTPTETPTDTPPPSPSASPTHTATPPPSATPSETPTGTPPATATPTLTPTVTATPSSSPTPSVTATPTFNADATLANIQTTIFNTTCLDAGCHNATDQQGNLVLEAGQSFGQLVNAPSFNVAAQEAGLIRVLPGSPDASFLVIKLQGPTVPQGARMPFVRPPLTADQIRLIRDWITQGAGQ